MTNNRGVHAYLSPPGRDAIELFGVEQGVSFSGLVEALAQAIIKGEDLTFLVELARQVDSERRRR